MAFDAIVVGAGPAGASMAGWLGRLGLDILLLEKASFPRDKPCGEGLLPPGAAALGRMGLLPALHPWARPLTGLIYRTGARSAASNFPAGEGGLGVRRLRLDSTLAGWARASGRVRFEEKAWAAEPILEEAAVKGVIVRSPRGARTAFRAPLTICAEGLHSTLRGRLGVRLRWPARRRMACVGHFDRVEGMGQRVEVFLGSAGEAYLTPTAEGVSAALLHEARSGARPDRFKEILQSFPSLRRRLDGSRLTGPPRVWGPLGPRADRVFGEGFLLIGDCAGSPDPITGEGLSLALLTAQRGAALAAEAAAAGGAARVLRGFGSLRSELAEGAFRLSRGLVAISRREWLRERVVSNLARRPPLFDKLVDVACGRRSFSSLSLLDGLGLVR